MAEITSQDLLNKIREQAGVIEVKNMQIEALARENAQLRNGLPKPPAEPRAVRRRKAREK